MNLTDIRDDINKGIENLKRDTDVYMTASNIMCYKMAGGKVSPNGYLEKLEKEAEQKGIAYNKELEISIMLYTKELLSLCYAIDRKKGIKKIIWDTTNFSQVLGERNYKNITLSRMSRSTYKAVIRDKGTNRIIKTHMLITKDLAEAMKSAKIIAAAESGIAHYGLSIEDKLIKDITVKCWVVRQINLK